MYLKTKLAIALIISLPMATYAAKDTDGEKIDLTLIEARLSELEAAVAVLETVSYEGNYTFTVSGLTTKDCQNSSIWGGDVTDLVSFAAHVASEEISWVATQNHLGNYGGVAASAGGVLTIPSYWPSGHVTSLIGDTSIFYPPSTAQIDLGIGGDGSMSYTGVNGESITGQFSADGGTFIMYGRDDTGIASENSGRSCVERNIFTMVGVRI